MEASLLTRMTGEELLLLRVLGNDGVASRIEHELARRAVAGSPELSARPARARIFRLAAAMAPFAAA